MRRCSSIPVAVPFLVAVLLPFTPGLAQEFQPGDQVELVEREIHIPAHPAPGDNRVPFRFASGSFGTVLSVDAETGWIELRGERVEGEESIGWIVSSYISGPVEEDGGQPTEPPELAWCPEKGSSSPAHEGRLRIATWNLGNLQSEDGQSTYTGRDPSVKRFPIDYARIRCYVRLFDPDVLAVQEVDGEEALQRVVDSDVHEIHVSSRPSHSLTNGKQNTGFAYKQGLDVEERPDVEDLDTSGNGALRRGVRIDVTVKGTALSMMSVHLKSGCFENDSGGSVCTKLFRQVPELEEWIDDAASGPNPFLILGDFNRRLNLDQDLVWTEIDDGVPPNADLETVTEDMPISCRDNRYTEFIDHVVVGKRAAQLVDETSFRHVTYRQADKQVWDKISDHCPIVVEMWIGE